MSLGENIIRIILSTVRNDSLYQSSEHIESGLLILQVPFR